MFGGIIKKDDGEGRSDIETIIGRNTVITGTVSGNGSVRVDGRIDGGIMVAGDVVIGEGGIVNGNISAKNILISGNVTGNITGEAKLTIDSNGRLTGDIRVRQFSMADGGVFQGRSDMTPRTDQPAAAQE